MKKIALSVIAVLSLIAPLFYLSHSASATTCPVKMPETLLSLYRSSDAIFIARYRGSDTGDVTHDDEEYTRVEIKKNFDISSVLKGKPLETFTLIDSDYRYKPRNAEVQTAEQVDQAQTVQETSIEDLESYEEGVSRELKAGDDALLFLRMDDDSKRLELTDYRDGLKNLPRSDIAVYEARIKELNSIFAAEKPSAEKVTAWLVRCAEDEATRWEGTYELQRSFDALDYKTQRDADRKTKIANGEPVDDETDYFNEGFDTGRTTVFATLLNDYQKQTLAGILLNTELTAKPKRAGEPGFVPGDSELMGLVSRWADARIAGLLIDRLRSGAYTAAENSDLMERIVSMIEDQQMSSLAVKYGNVYYEDDASLVGENDLADFEEMTKVEDETETAEPEVEAVPATQDVPAANAVEQVPENVDEVLPAEATPAPANADEAQTVKRTKLTARQFREMLIAAFLLRADQVMANPDTRIRAAQ